MGLLYRDELEARGIQHIATGTAVRHDYMTFSLGSARSVAVEAAEVARVVTCTSPNQPRAHHDPDASVTHRSCSRERRTRHHCPSA